MALYETVFIARQDMSPAQVETLADEYGTLMDSLGGKVEKREHWGLKTLAYRIKKNRKGHYVLFNFEAPGDAVAELERRMRLSEDVLRYLTMRIEAVDERPSIMLQARPRDDRPRRDSRPRGDAADRKPEGADQEAAAVVSEAAS
ncbi:MAG: 30S ribosomal protein S6 [Alphaproteobacteria bacterium]|nr:30S ribosomal protein S6 [Alphaproteobacteria bacterium]MCY4230780.1 30S ribosomal protein S6 [Alphaproteobacteria bacterium]MCY4317988.1 30S ribosomal protein S6 [Alphaproteobacteria bacterium]